ncbi:hydroxyisourate hydrolase [uncultured Methylophaga sp.]|uniref:hydroxyisourate hydrolase n=1 Tax=uncultured Methylophaga sp. TaxID=285271 RepID=UPI00262CC011|nr:hydroxyisourate hydrolase [uncultured Methylophaga sp.]
MMQKLLPLIFMLLCVPLQAQQADSQLSLQVTDTEQSLTVEGMTAVLYRFSDTSGAWQHIDTKKTDTSGRIDDVLQGVQHEGVYRLVLRSRQYFRQQEIARFYPLIPIVFSLEKGQPLHLSLALTEQGYRISRGEPGQTEP